jgi:phosphoglycolate phosphatase
MLEGIKAVGFDMDGTFLKTHVDYAKLSVADVAILESHGIPFEEGYKEKYIKRPRWPIKAWLESHGREDEFNAISKEIDAAFTKVEKEYVTEAVPYPGSKECLGELRSMGLKTGLLTRGSLEYAEAALDVTGTRDGFDAVMGRDFSSYDDAKPSPVAMRQLASLLGVDPAEILYVGDNVTDYMSAHGAGAKFVGVLTGSGTREKWKEVDPAIPVIERAGDCVELLRN